MKLHVLTAMVLCATTVVMGQPGKAPQKSAAATKVAAGPYLCSVVFSGSYINSGILSMSEDGKYTTDHYCDGKYEFDRAKRQIRFVNGGLAALAVKGDYIPAGRVKSGIPARSAPAIILNQDKKNTGATKLNDVPTQYCYLQKAKAPAKSGAANKTAATHKQ